MTNEQLIEGEELVRLINLTEKAIGNLKSIKRKTRMEGRSYEDGVYNLSISEHTDGSGVRADLSRYYGNERVLGVVIAELEQQLSEFRAAFKAL